MPGPASIAGKYPQYGNASWNDNDQGDLRNFAGLGGPPGLYRGTLGGGPPTVARAGNEISLASVLAGGQKPSWPMAGYGQGLEMNPYNPMMEKPMPVGGGGGLMPVGKEPYIGNTYDMPVYSNGGGGFQKPSKPSIGSQYGGGKPRIGYGGGQPSPEVMQQMAYLGSLR